MLIKSSLSRQYGESQGVQPDQEQVSAALAANAQSIGSLPAEERAVFRRTLRGVRRGPADADRGRAAAS